MADDEFAAEFRSFRSNVFRIDRTTSPLGVELEQFQRWQAGDRTPPTEYEWLAPWLEQLAEWRSKGKWFTRVRVLSDPPTEYQRWLIWGTPWMTMPSAHENIRYMTARAASSVGLPAGEWTMFDEERVFDMQTRTLITDRRIVERYRGFRHLAVQHSTTVANLAA